MVMVNVYCLLTTKQVMLYSTYTFSFNLHSSILSQMHYYYSYFSDGEAEPRPST